MNKTVQWEDVMQEPVQAGYLQRAKVQGGWLVRETLDVLVPTHDGNMTNGYEWRSSLVFIPDAQHLWLNEGDRNAE